VRSWRRLQRVVASRAGDPFVPVKKLTIQNISRFD